MAFDPLKTKDECVAWIRDFFEENGKGCSAVIGISGGKDSSVVAALCAEALGKDRVIGVLMPDGEQSDIDMARLLVEHLGIKHYVVNIKGGTDGIKEAIPFDLSEQSRINLPPRIRMSTLYAVSQSHNGRVANTCNLSEDWVGYSTRYGDSAGDFSPCSHLTVAEVKEIGRVLGLPECLIEKVPSDGLSGMSDEDKLGFTYAELDRYIRTGSIENKEHKEKIDRLHRQNLFKLRLMPSFDPGLRVSDSCGAEPKAYGLGIIVGRFQTLHMGHEYMIRMAMALCDRVLVFIGSSQEEGTEKNPFSYELRKDLLKTVFGDRIMIYPLPDIGVGNNGNWGDYVIENAEKVCGMKPDLLISGKEERRRDWFDGVEGLSISELYVPKTIDISASEMREFFIEDDQRSWKRYVDRRLWPRYGELRDIVLKASRNKDTESI